MNRAFQNKTQAPTTPSFVPVRSGLLRRRSANQTETVTMPPIAREELHSSGQPLAPATHPGAESRFNYDFNRIQTRTVAPKKIQTKLTVNQPGDKYEREADRVADQIMCMPKLPHPHLFVPEREASEETVQTQSLVGRITPLLQRQVVPQEEEEEVEGVPHTEENVREMEESNVSAKRRGGAGTKPMLGHALATVQRVLSHGERGKPLDGETRTFMESRFGHDFSQVRVHTDRQAHEAAQAIQARAFTQGRDIWFGRNEYRPGTETGYRLLAHELTHTLQQQGGAAPLVSAPIQRSICPDACQGPVSRGELCRADRVTRDNCGERGAEDESNKISHIRVLLGSREVHLFWNGRPRTAEGKQEVITNITPNSSKTPTGWDKVGNKCGPDHTSWKRYNLAWFTAFRSTDYRIGFHNSQPLGAGYQSAGCVRTTCEAAEKINKNSKSNWTSIIVR